MQTAPESLYQQKLTHCKGEIYRGCGIWPMAWSNFQLEPYFEPFDECSVTRWDLGLNGLKAPYQGLSFFERLMRGFRPLPPPSDEPYYMGDQWIRQRPFCVTTVSHYIEDEVTYPKAEQLLLALGQSREPMAFELFGIGEPSGNAGGEPRIEARFVASQMDVALLEAQLHTLYPRSAVVTQEYDDENGDPEWTDRVCAIHSYGENEPPFFVAPLYLPEPYCHPIRTFSKLDTDPLAPAVAILEELRAGEWALVQVLFQRAKHPWANNLRMACEDPYKPGQMVYPEIDRKLLDDKTHSPFYAVNIHLVSNSSRALADLRGFVEQYEGVGNRLAVRDAEAWAKQWGDEEFPVPILWRPAICYRESMLPGMLLNVRELTGIMHLPNSTIPSERLLRVKSQTRQPPKPVLDTTNFILGQNVHRGQVRRVATPPEIRSRHCYIAGASGTGKSTLLLNMILQDIAAGHGVGLLDPHGDLVKMVARRIPKHRINDVVLFNAADTEYPFALNILDAHDETERERIVAETIMALERYFPASWGPRLERILQYTLRTVLHAVSGATLADVEQMLTDSAYREDVLQKTTDPQLLQFWNNQFKFFSKNACDPVLNKLSPFLLERHVRNIICQRHAAINFDEVINSGRILLANLSTGLLTEKVAGTLGSFLVTKIVNAAFRRAGLPEGKRRPWYLYVDEFQNFMNLSVGFERILAEARKYRLVLAGLANQYVGQLNPGVRQAIFGNVQSLIIFRLGVEDAHAVSKELGVFTADDILNLEVGQAIARIGTSQTTFNLQTFKEPPVPEENPIPKVVTLARQRYARPRREVEAELVPVAKAAEKLALIAESDEGPSDPSEDDLVR